MTPILTLWPSAETDTLSIKIDHLMESQSRYNLYSSLRCADTDAAELAREISEAFTSLITLTMADTTLHIVAVSPVSSADAAAMLRKVRRAVADSGHQTTLHVVGLRASVIKEAGATVEDEVKVLEQWRREEADGKPFSYTLVDNFVSSGAPLNFTIDSLGEYLALLFGALISDYYAIFPPAVVNAMEGESVALGAASLRFDRPGAVEFLLRRAFLAALDREGINNREVDSQKAVEKARSILAGIEECFPRFRQLQVLEKFRDTDLTEGEVIAQTDGPMRAEIKEIEQRLTAFLSDPSLTFPEKEGILAVMLGRDNDVLKGIQYDGRTAVVDDGCRASVELFVNAFNADGNRPGNLPVRSDFESLRKYVRNPQTGELEESVENQKAFYPLDILKSLKQQIQNQTAFIRRKEDELHALDKADRDRREIERTAVMAEGTDAQAEGSPLDDAGKRRRAAADSDVVEQPLSDLYIPPADLKPAPSVDLRPYFSGVRDQSDLGSCATFAVVSMYEALMNRYNANGLKADLSERFVYYFSNVAKGKPEGGSNYFDQLAVLGRQGVCREELFGYSTSHLDREPTQDALDDAANHRVLQARQIPLECRGDRVEAMRRNHELLTSALSQGFPVGIALDVYDSFGKNGPFVNRPEEAELAGEVEHHALVLAGYSEEQHCYIVRNSWGKDFGDNGYCYISAAYVDDPQYNTFA